MSHHFDTPTAREDPRINLCDLYLFSGRSGFTTMALTVNPDASISAPDTFRHEAIYAFRFDTDGDHVEDVTFKIGFGEPTHAEGEQHRHCQTYHVRIATGEMARSGDDGDLLLQGRTAEILEGPSGVAGYAGLVPDIFAGDGIALGIFRNALFNEGIYRPDAFLNRTNIFERRNVTAIVIEVPTALIGRGKVTCWATVSLFGHAPEMQVCRWGLPLLTNAFIPDMEMREEYNRCTPPDDRSRFGDHIAELGARLSGLAGTAEDPVQHGRALADRLLPAVLPYELGTPASFSVGQFNGRALTDDAMDVMLTLATNTLLVDGVAPSDERVLRWFPYFGHPYSAEEQAGLPPAITRK